MPILVDEPDIRHAKRVARDRNLSRTFVGYDPKSFRSSSKRADPDEQHEAEQGKEAASHEGAPSSGMGDRSVRKKRITRSSVPVTTRPAPITPIRS